MGLWMFLLLLQLHLAVVCLRLPAPCNVSISSFNLEHTLVFLPGPETPPDARFAVETLRPSKSWWRPVATCLELKAGQTCNLTRVFRDPFAHYRARVQAFTANRTSNWTATGWFEPLVDTVLGPPDVSVSGCGNCLLLRVRRPAETGSQQLLDLHRELVFNVQRTRDGAQFRLSVPNKEEIIIRYLQPGVEYCVTVAVKTLFNSNAVTSAPHCAFTSPPQPLSSLYVVYCLVAAFCALGVFLIVLVASSSPLSITLLKQRLQHTLNGGPSEPPGQISVRQPQKDDHRPPSDQGQEGCGLAVTPKA